MDQCWDYVVVGSGFGGSVAARRLAQKGYSVLVVEQGRRWRPEDYPSTNWKVWDSFWFPKIFCTGIQQLTLLRDSLVLHGAGVGGGSLVYANVLMTPTDEAFQDPKWRDLRDWKAVLEPHYAEARRMLGVVTNPRLTRADEVLREVAEEMGREGTFEPTQVAVFFGEPDRTVPDPYFGGEGPDRTGCTFCAGCMVGCRVGAKNTLDRNYLYLAEKRGARILPETQVTLVAALPEGGYRLETERATRPLLKRRSEIRARNVVVAAGVLGSVPLLMESKRRGALPHLSDRLGDYARTNSEALLGITGGRRSPDLCEGVAITSHVFLDDVTRFEPVRYPRGSDVMCLLGTPLTDGGTRLTRPLKWIGNCLRRPGGFLRTLWPLGRARKTVILLVMQTLDNRMRLLLKRRWFWPFGRTLTSEAPPDQPRVPAYIPLANEAARKVAQRLGATPQSSLNEVLLNIPTTAHILGGCAMGKSPEDGVVDAVCRAFGHEGLFVCDGSVIGANLGVNPSLTIAALTEYAMSRIPARDDSPRPG
jgi:cholesterol oxidase